MLTVADGEKGGRITITEMLTMGGVNLKRKKLEASLFLLHIRSLYRSLYRFVIQSEHFDSTTP